MDDIAGCRLIFNTIEELRAFRSGMHRARFNHRLRNDPKRYDYIERPNQETGYRGIHDIYEYDVNSNAGKPYKGLFVEIQYRTFVQHAWATAVEVIGLITENEPKFQRGDDRYKTLMAYASEILARTHENMTSCFPNLTDENLVREFLTLDEEVGLLKLLRSRNAIVNESDASGNVLLMITEGEKLELENYRDATEALRALFKHEKDNPGRDIVLVRAGSPEDVRIAFRNYYTDTSEFVRLLEEGCEKLTGHESQYFGFPDEEGLIDADEEEDG